MRLWGEHYAYAKVRMQSYRCPLDLHNHVRNRKKLILHVDHFKIEQDFVIECVILKIVHLGLIDVVL